MGAVGDVNNADAIAWKYRTNWRRLGQRRSIQPTRMSQSSRTPMCKLARCLSRVSTACIGSRRGVYFLASAAAVVASTVSTPCFAQTQLASAPEKFAGLTHILPAQVWIVASGALLYAVTFAHGAHSEGSERGSSAQWKAKIALIGCWLAFTVYAWRFAQGAADGPLGFLIVAILAALAVPVVLVEKAFAFADDKKLIPGRRRKVSASYRRVLEPPPPGPPEHRLRAAVRAPSVENARVVSEDNAAGGPTANPDRAGAAKRV